VIAARSAHHLGDFANRDEYLAKAEGRTPEASLLRQITQAELFLKERRIDDALDVLKRLRSEAPKNITAIKLELKAQTLAKNWDDVLTLSALLEKRKAILPQHAAQNRFNAQLGNLQRKAQEPDEIYAYWQQLASVDKQNATLASTAARLLISAGDHEHAKTMIEKSLDQRWDAGLVELYGNCIGAEPLRQVEWAEARLPQHQRDADLLLTLGKLCMQVKLWGKARSYIEASISIEPKRAAHAALAQLLAKTGNPEDAARHNRKFYSPGNE
jgi:HemY protein